MTPDYENQDRLNLLKGRPLSPEPPSIRTPTLLKKARLTLAEVMDDHDAKPSERVLAADSVLDRWGDPRKKYELGGSRTLNIQLPPQAMTDALSALSKVFQKGDVIDISPVPSPKPLPSPDDLEGNR